MANPLQYSTANFTVSGGVVDAEQLRQEFAAASFPSTPVVFSHLNTNEPGVTPRVLVWFNIAPNATDTATANAIVAAHTALGPNLVLVPGYGVFEVPRDRIRGKFTVGKGGAVDYSSIKSAVDAAIAAGASPYEWYTVEVSSGVYFENPMVVPTGVVIDGLTASVVVLATTPTESLFTLAGGIVSDITAGGVTGSTEAAFKTTSAGLVSACLGCTVVNSTHGFLASGAGVYLGLSSVSVAVDMSGVGVTGAFVKADNGARVMGTAIMASASAALLPFYAGNPIAKVIWADNGSLISLTTASIDVAAKDSAQVAVLSDRGSMVVLTAVTVENCHTALKIGSGGTGSKLVIQGSSLRTNAVDFSIQSSTGLISASCSVDHAAVADVITGGVLTGVLFDTANVTTQTRGTAVYLFPSQRGISIPDFYHARTSTGISAGGAVTVASGLSVNVSAGNGWVVRENPGDVQDVSWAAVLGLALTASAINYVYYDGTNLSGIKASTSQPGGESIQLAAVVTNASGVRFSHSILSPTLHSDQLGHNYLVATRKFAIDTGLVTSQGSGATKLVVGPGAYFRALNRIVYSGSGGNAVWSYFYGTNGATEVASVSSLNVTQYDDAGTLTTMTAGFYRPDTLMLTSDGRLSLIYGTAQYATQGAAEIAGTAKVPTFLEESGVALALVVVLQGVGIASILDARPRPGTSSGLGVGGSGATDHGDLSGLEHDDHTQYLLVAGSRVMGGNLDVGGNSIVSVNLVDGVDVSSHASRHNAGAADALVTGSAVAALIGQVSAEGSAASYARSDHTHAHAGGAPVGVSKAGNAEGVATTFSRADHKHDVATAAPGTTGVAVASADGSATTLARSDHTHQSNTAPVNVTRVAAAIGTSGEPARADHKHDVTTAAPGAIGIATASGDGVATTLARSDHTHQSNTAPVNVTKAAAAIGTSGQPARADHKHDVTTAAPGAIGVATASADGSTTTLARSDHTHQSATAPVSVTKDVAAIGTSGEPARADHKHDVATAAPGTTGVATASGDGVATTLARSDHTHQSNTAPVNVTRAAAAIGTSGEPARADHKHDVTTAAPVLGIGAGNSEGTATSLARSDHNHKIRETGGPTELTLGAIADGQIVFRSGSALVGVGLQDLQGMRLTGVSAMPVMNADALSLSTIYLTPYRSNQISLYDGSQWILYSTAEVSLAVTGRTTDLPFDVFAFASGGTVTLEFTNWASSTARATALVRNDGVWCRSGALTRRYMGTCRPRSATTYSWVTVGTDAPARFDLWNSDNKVQVAFDLTTATNTWAYTIATWRQAQGLTNYQVDVVAGLEDCRLVCLLTVTSRNSAGVGGNSPREVGIGFDSTTVPIGVMGSSGSTGGINQISQATGAVLCPLGRHFAAWLEVSQAASVTTWVGDDGGIRIVSGMQGTWFC